MRTENAPQTRYLKDYTAPDFSIKETHLNFDIRNGRTTVTATTTFERRNQTARSLMLDGQKMELLGIKINGESLSPNRFRSNDTSLTIDDVPDRFTLEIITAFAPENNTALEGLYQSSGIYCTQCEPEGFRNITYFIDRPDVMTTYTTRIEADKKTCPILLSNGNRIESGELPNGRHFAVWHDPFVKPTYLFALVAGDLKHIHDTFTTASGKKVDLYIYVNPGNEDKCRHAMDSLIASMRWDEEKYGREYDLNVFHIVAVNDFNFGAMENKSLNIFNSRLVLAKPETATDADYLAIESVVAHEYFHNWTGNRITCRDWFQLSLKEGLTVFRDQCFSADMHSEAVQRIDDVEGLRNMQFPEDASPMAHPIRPDNYIEINNFYTATVYEKGAEIIRMMHTLLGPEKYRKATDLYFQRHDGQAVTCDDFVQCMQDASGVNLSQFKLWYSQSGTPQLTVKQSHDATTGVYKLTITQQIPDTPGQTNKKPMHIPVAVGLLDSTGKNILPEGTRILHLKDKEQTFSFENVKQKPVPSILRGFSAPVKLASDLTDTDLLFLMAHDTDGFNRWDAGQTYMQRLMLGIVAGKQKEVPDAFLKSFAALIGDSKADKALLAKAMLLPSDAYLAQLMDVVDVDGLHAARKTVSSVIGKTFATELENLYTQNIVTGAYKPDAQSVGKRRLRSAALRFIHAANETKAVQMAAQQYRTATNMTDKISAMSILTDTSTPEKAEIFSDFYNSWKHEPLVLDKWFSLQGAADRTEAPEQVAKLTQHPDFTYKNPNRVRSLLGSFTANNQKWFHRPDGAGYKVLADTVITLNGINPQTAARLVNAFRQWRRYDASRKVLMENELRRILSQKDISNDVFEIVSKSLS